MIYRPYPPAPGHIPNVLTEVVPHCETTLGHFHTMRFVSQGKPCSDVSMTTLTHHLLMILAKDQEEDDSTSL